MSYYKFEELTLNVNNSHGCTVGGVMHRNLGGIKMTKSSVLQNWSINTDISSLFNTQTGIIVVGNLITWSNHLLYLVPCSFLYPIVDDSSCFLMIFHKIYFLCI